MASILLPFHLFINSVLFIVACFSIARGCVERERVALLDFKISFASFPQNHAKLSSWNTSSQDCCEWEGIGCDWSGVHVVRLELDNQGLQSHHLRPSLLELQHLTTLILRYNNFSMRIPEFIGSFKELQELDLSNAGFFGSVPPQLANLSILEYLLLGPIEFSEASDWLFLITKIPNLYEFVCSSCSFPDALPTTHFNSSSSQLQSLSLTDSIMSSSTFSLFLNTTFNLSTLQLYSPHFQGQLPNIFDQIGNLCNLGKLLIQGCSIPDLISNVHQFGCAGDSLVDLDLSSNNLTGLIPSLLMFPSLTYLYLHDNQLEGFASHNTTDLLLNTNTSHIFPPTLSDLSISNNALSGVLLSEHFANISQLQDLELDNNPNLAVSFNEPPREIVTLHLRSCNLGPVFPTWILALENIEILDISNSNLSGFVPTIFWRNLPSTMFYLNFSSNNFTGVLPTYQNFSFLSQNFAFWLILDLSSNGFYGPLSLFFLEAIELHLSNNKFSSFAPLPYPNKYKIHPTGPFQGGLQIISMLDISDNILAGEIPDWAWIAISSFKNVNLSNNSLSGEVPSSTQTDFYILNLSNNRFVGQIPSFLRNSTSLRILDLSRNKFHGMIPSWIGEGLQNLAVFSLESNNFTGTLQRNLCHLRSLRILDLSHNKLSGTTPSCVNNFVAMAGNVNVNVITIVEIDEDGGFDTGIPIIEAKYYRALIKWKGLDRWFDKNLELLSLIDLSYNNLSGELPGSMMSLTKLYSLDMSSNNFTGSIPNQIGKLKNLEYLNLSYNSISGAIPASIADITSIGMLDLSHNKLSGRIPKGNQLQTFNSSSFTANPGLCGEPLVVKCPGDPDDSTQPLQSPPEETHEGDERGDMQWFYAGSGVGFACGFLGIIATLTWIKDWRYAFFRFATELGEWFLLVVALGASRISRKLRLK